MPPQSMRRLIEFFARAERGDDHRHLVLLAKREIMIEPVVRPVHDLVDRERRRRPLGMRPVMGGELFLDARQPLVEQRRRARVQRRKRADHARLALRDHEIGHGNDEQRRTDHGDRQAALEQGRHGHMLEILFAFVVGGKALAAWKDARHHPKKAMTCQGPMSLSGHDRPAQMVKPASTRRSRGPSTSKVRHPENAKAVTPDMIRQG